MLDVISVYNSRYLIVLRSSTTIKKSSLLFQYQWVIRIIKIVHLAKIFVNNASFVFAAIFIILEWSICVCNNYAVGRCFLYTAHSYHFNETINGKMTHLYLFLLYLFQVMASLWYLKLRNISAQAQSQSPSIPDEKAVREITSILLKRLTLLMTL